MPTESAQRTQDARNRIPVNTTWFLSRFDSGASKFGSLRGSVHFHFFRLTMTRYVTAITVMTAATSIMFALKIETD